ncbi:MAG: hypothetical protein ACLFWF_07675 [Alphaproteobacteria bacterium]
MFTSRIRAGAPVLLAAFLSGAAGLAGCATEDFEREPVFEEPAGPGVYGEPEVYENEPGVFGDQVGPGYDEGLYDDDIGPGFDGVYEDEIGPGFDEIYGDGIYGGDAGAGPGDEIGGNDEY